VPQTHRKENRRHKRIFFSPDERVSVSLSVDGASAPVQADVLDLSESGIGLSLARGVLGVVRPGTRLFLACLRGWADIDFDPRVEIEVKWVLDHEFLGRIAFGSEFQNMPDNQRLLLRRMIA